MRDIHKDILYYDYNMYHTTIKHVYKYPEGTLRLLNLSSSDFLGLGRRQWVKFIQIYHTTYLI